MNNSQQKPTLSVVVSLVCLLSGLIIGYLVIGRYIWPVQWYNAEPVHMTTESQEDYLRMAIDSFTLNPDAALSQTRYSLLGEDAASTLAAIQANPGTTDPQAITAFSVAVTGTTPVTARATGATTLSILLGVVCVIGLFVIFGLLFFFALFRRGKGEEVEPGQAEVFEEMPMEETLPVETVPAVVTLEGEQPMSETVPSQVVGDTQPVVVPGAGETEPVAPPLEETPQEEPVKMRYDLEYIEGIGPIYADKLKAIGIQDARILLEVGATPKGREEIAVRSGISSKLILKWVNHVDLFRIKGIGSEYADLLEVAGVDTVVELATRNPAHLHQTLITVNEEKHLVRQVPALLQVENWVAQAKQLPRKITY